MKICDNCKAYNSSDRIFCVDCGEKLGDNLTDYEEEQFRDSVDEKIEKLYNKKDPLYVSGSDKILGALSLAGVLCSLVIMIIGKITQRSFEYMWVWVLLLLLAAVEALMPRVTWELEKIRLSFTMNGTEDAEPSDFYIYCRKAAIIISVAIGIGIMIFNLLDFRHPPIRKYISQIARTESVAMSSFSGDYIDANPEKWQKIIATKDYAVSVFLEELRNARTTGLEETLMIDAIMEISGRDDITYTNKDDFLFWYNSSVIS